MNSFSKGAARTAAFIAVAAAYGVAQAQDIPGTEQFAAPANSVAVGIGYSSGDKRDRARFGLFNGLRERDANALLGFNYSNLDGSAGTWLTFSGRNLGLDNRELGFSYRRFGDLRITGDYSELVRHDPRTINTSMQGAGTTTPTVSLLATPGTGQDLNLELKRRGLGLGIEKWLSPTLSFEASFKNEEKDGARLWGRGFGCAQMWVDVGACTAGTAAVQGASGVLMLPEPVDSTHRQAEARLNYSSGKLVLSGGYYGSFYTNHHGNLTNSIVGPLGDQNGGLNPVNPGLLATLSLPMALWPDNQAHQFSLGGNYAFTPKTRVNFKYVYTRATQKESFGGMGLANAPAGRSSLDGEINTTKAQIGFSAHPFAKLHLHGDVVYNEKKNKTPIDNYNAHPTCVPPAVYSTTTRDCVPVAAAFVSRTYTNGNASPKKYDAKIEANYKLTANYSIIGGLKYEHEDFGTWTPTDVAGGVTGLKQKLAETGWRVELRRSMSETINGSIAFERARREGKSPWLRPVDFKANAATGVTEVSDSAIFSRTAIFPFIYMDRTREKVKLTGSWTPVDKLSFQVFLDEGKDTYRAPTEHGLRSFRMSNIALDATYALTDNWKFSAYGSRGRQTVDAGHSTGYDAILKDTATAFGIGVKGTPAAQFRVGADLTMLHDLLKYQQTADPAASAANATFLATSGGLPDVTYRLARFNLYGEYLVQKNATVRLDFVHHRTFFNEWTYQLNGRPFLYSDNTTINAQEKQSVSFLGASFIYNFR